MNKTSRVSLSSVNIFKSSVDNLVNFSHNLPDAKGELADLLNQLTILENTARESITGLEKTNNIIETKIQKINILLSHLYEERDWVQKQIEDVEYELDFVSEYLTEYDENGNQYEVDNPVYLALLSKLSSLELKLSQIEQKIFQTEKRLEKAEEIFRDITDTMSSLGDAVVALLQERTECQQLMTEVDEIYQFTIRDGNYVIDKLNHIEAAIDEYISVHMKLDNSLSYNRQSNISVNQMINLNLNIAVDKSNITEINNIVTESNSIEQNINKKEYFDDNGNLYRVGNELVKNCNYQKNGYKYETDGQGRIKSASGKLITVEKHNRNMPDKINIIGKGDELKTDDRGHIIGHQFNGSGRMENLIPQDCDVNQNDYRDLEDKLSDQVKEGNEVNVNIIPFYESESRRPVGIFYFYTINGIAHTVLFPNKKIEEL